MLTGGQKRDTLVSPRTYLIFLLVALLVCPPWAYGDQISWNGGGTDSEYDTVANWTDVTNCSNCSAAAAPGQYDDASIHSGGGNPANVYLDLEGSGLDAVTVNSMSIRGGHVSSTASLNVLGTSITFGTPFNTSGNVLSIGNRGTLNIGTDPNNSSTVPGTAVLELSGGGGSLFPNQPNSVGAYVASGGQINLSGGGQLVLQNQIGGTRVLTNNGNIAITAAADGTALTLNSYSSYFGQPVLSTFVLSGTGTLTLGGDGTSAITGATGAETLVNGANQTIQGSGIISGLAAITNNGTLEAQGVENKESANSQVGTNSLETGGNGTLAVNSSLTNWNGVNGKLTGGTYSASGGGTLLLSSIGAGNSIQTLNLASVNLSGNGSITGDAVVQANALGGLSTINDSSLSLGRFSSLTIAPSSGRFPTLTLSSNSVGVPSSLNLSSYATLTVEGTLKSSASTYGLPSESANSNINIGSFGTLNVDNLVTSANNSSASSNITVNQGYLEVSNNVRQGGGFGSPLSTGNNTLSLSNGAQSTVSGNFSNNSGGGTSIVSVDGVGTSLAVDGTFSQWQGNGGAGVSELNLTNGASMTVGTLRNSSSLLNLAPIGAIAQQSQISITGGSTLTVSNNFANVSGGVLSGGSYTLGTGAALNYNNTDGTDINTIGANTLVTLDNAGAGVTGTIQNQAVGGNTLANSLNTVSGALTLQNGARLQLASSLTIGSGGQVSLIGGGNVANSLTANGLTNGGTILIAPGDTADFSGGGTALFTNLNSGVLTGGGNYNIGGTLLFGQGQGGSGDTSITTLSGVNVSLTGSGAILSGTGQTDALTNLTEINTGSSLTLNSTSAARSFSGLTIDNTSSLTLNSSSATFQLGGGSNNASVSADNEGTINVNGGSSLTLAGSTGPVGQAINGPGTFTNNGALNIGSTATGYTGVATLQTDGGGSAFTIGGTGTVTLAGQGQIVVGAGDSLTVASNLSSNNWNGSSLTGGAYNVGNGSILTLSSIGGNTIQSLANGAAVTINGSGLLTGDGSTIALAGLTSVNSISSLTLQGGANLALTSTTFTNAGTVSITGGSTFDVSNVGNFQDVDGSGNMSGNYLIGKSSSLTYSGADINQISGNLTLDNTGGTQLTGNTLNTTGQITNVSGGSGAHDALSNSLTNVNSGGTLALQNGAQLFLTSSSFANGGNVSITNGSTLDVTGVGTLGNGFNDINSGVMNGNYLIGTGSTLNYSGSAVTQISGSLTLDNTNGTQSPNTTGTITNAGGDALSGSLNTIGNGGSLTLQNGALLSLTSQAGFTNNYGNVNVVNGSTLDLSGTNFSNATNNPGTLSAGSYLIGSNSYLNYSGTDINTIDGATSLTLDNANGGTTGLITNGGASAGNDALSNSLTTNNGSLALQNGASLTLGSQAFTNGNGASITVDAIGNGGSSLTTGGHFTNYDGTVSLGFADVTGASNGMLNANAGFANKADDNQPQDYAGSAITSLDSSSATVTGRLYNGAISSNGVSQAGQGGNPMGYGPYGPYYSSADAEIDLYSGSTLTVNGSVKNLAVDTSNGLSLSTASINLDSGSALTVNGAFTNSSANLTGYASLNLTNNSTATISGLFTNTGGSLVSLDYSNPSLEGSSGNGGSSLTVNGGFTNYNSTVLLSYNSAMTVAGGFQNLADDSNNSQGYGQSLLVLGSYGEEGGDGQQIGKNFGLPQVPGQSLNGGSIATITGGLVNNASTSNGGTAQSFVVVNSGSVLNVDNLTNSASVNTPQFSQALLDESFEPDLAQAGILVSGGSHLNVTGNLSNTGSQPLFFATDNFLGITASVGYAQAGISVSGGSTLTVGGALTNTNATVTLACNSFLNSTGGVLNSATDTLAALYNFPVGPPLVGDAEFSLNDSAAKVTGGFTNSAVSLLGGLATGNLSLDNSYMKVDTLTNTATATGIDGTAIAKVKVDDDSFLHVTGDVNNTSSAALGFAAAKIYVNGSSMQVDGAFSNTSATLGLANGASATVAGLFTNDTGSVVNLDAVGSGFSTLSANGGFSNQGAVNLYNGSGLYATYTQTGATYSPSGPATSVTTIDAGSYIEGDVEVQGGLLTGGGTVYGNLTVDGSSDGTTQGTLNPGDPQDFYVEGDYDQTALGILTLDFDDFDFADNLPVGGVDYDQIYVTGNVNLNGTLSLDLQDGFNAQVGTVFDIVNWTNGTETGDFSNFIDPVFDNGTLTFMEYNNNLNAGQVDLVVIAAPVGSSTPEPSTLSMLFCAMLLGGGITWRTRRRRGNV